jgi:UDP-N-acetylglucosamine 2-epimerase
MMLKKTVHLIAAARPNFMKIAPLYHALKKESWCEPLIVHTGQHYDINMSDAFFTDLGLPEPHVHLGVGSGSHAEQAGKVMIAYEKLIKWRIRVMSCSMIYYPSVAITMENVCRCLGGARSGLARLYLP